MSSTLLERSAGLHPGRLSRRRSLAELRWSSPPRQHVIMAVVTDSFEDLIVTRRAAEVASSTGYRLVLAVALPGEGRIIERDPFDHSLPADVEAAVGRVRPALDARRMRYTVMSVPFRDRGSVRWRAWRISMALLRAARMVDARQLFVGQDAFAQRGAEPPELHSVAVRLSIAAGSSTGGRPQVTVVTPEQPVGRLRPEALVDH